MAERSRLASFSSRASPSPPSLTLSRSSTSTPVQTALTAPSTSLHSEASSISNFDLSADAILLVQDPDPETETDDTSVRVVSAHVGSSAVDEESKKTLRDQLRRTLSHKPSSLHSPTIRSRTVSSKGKDPQIDDITRAIEPNYPPRDYFVLTDAGKPVFIHSETHSSSINSETTTSIVGIIQALISIFLDDNEDKLRCINAGRMRITFLLRQPLYYACVSKWGEPESVTRSHLEYLHLQILSIITAAQLRRFFERRTNFDLGRLLAGADSFLTSLLHRLEFDLAMATASLHCLKLEPSLRKKAAEALVPKNVKDILYVLLVAQDRVVSLVRPKKHSVHPADVHIILNTIHAPSILNSPASGSWIPICLPKYNPAIFVNAYVSYLRKDEPIPVGEVQNSSDGGDERDSHSASSSGSASHHRHLTSGDPDLALVCVSGGQQNFDTARIWCESVIQKLETEGIVDQLTHSILGTRTPRPSAISSSSNSIIAASSAPLAPPQHPPIHRVTSGHNSHAGWVPSRALTTGGTSSYSVSDLGIPGLRHFVYKARSLVQITHPVFEDLYEDVDEKRRLITLYEILHDGIHGKSGQEGTLKLQYIKTDKEAVMGWITQPFEMYITISPLLPKSAAINAANAVARWVKKEEARLFLKDAPVF